MKPGNIDNNFTGSSNLTNTSVSSDHSAELGRTARRRIDVVGRHG